MSCFFHGTSVEIVNKLIPNHGRVFLTPYFDVSLFFTARFSDFQISLDIDSEGLPIVTELVEGALKQIYYQKHGIVCSVNIDQNELVGTQWRGEFVYDREILISDKFYFCDMFCEINKRIDCGKIKCNSFNLFRERRIQYLIQKGIKYYKLYGLDSLSSLKELHPDVYRVVLKLI